MFASEEGNENINQDEDTDENSIVKPKGTLKPERNRNIDLDNVIDFLLKQEFPTFTKHKSNIDKKTWFGLKALKQNENIVIKEADKGGCVVIVNKEHMMD